MEGSMPSMGSSRGSSAADAGQDSMPTAQMVQTMPAAEGSQQPAMAAMQFAPTFVVMQMPAWTGPGGSAPGVAGPTMAQPPIMYTTPTFVTAAPVVQAAPAPAVSTTPSESAEPRRKPLKLQNRSVAPSAQAAPPPETAPPPEAAPPPQNGDGAET